MEEAILEALCASFDLLNLAVIILAAEGRILFANKAAKVMLAVGRPIRNVDGCLQGRDRAASADLARSLAAVLSPAAPDRPSNEAHELCLSRSSRERGSAIAYLRAISLSDGGDHVAAVFITQTGGTRRTPYKTVAESFGLSKAETRIFYHLMEARIPAEIASMLNISPCTVKTHTRKILQKTNTARQADLLRLVECLRAPLPKSFEPSA
jgi:DNA-binding CsgD family transcriptional regulator